MVGTVGPLALTDTFGFSCSAQVPCFNDCCRDLNQLLTPYDILRLKKRLALPSDLFLQRYTRTGIGPETGLPVVTLKAGPAPEKPCPFVSRQGCRVYEDRPSSCRMYPLARVVSRSRETGRIREAYLLLQEPHCLGFTRNRIVTVGQWLVEQEFAAYNQMNDLMMDIIGMKNARQPGPLDNDQQRVFRLALYDLDTFRNFLDQAADREKGGLEPDAARGGDDETELLRFGFQWVKRNLFP